MKKKIALNFFLNFLHFLYQFSSIILLIFKKYILFYNNRYFLCVLYKHFHFTSNLGILPAYGHITFINSHFFKQMLQVQILTNLNFAKVFSSKKDLCFVIQF